MAGSGKKSRKAKAGTDRLSSLDDSLLLSILCFLETVDAVRTCVLSKRWRDLWNSLPVLRVGPARYFREKEFSFANLVNQFLLRRENCELHEVRLFFSKDFDSFAAEAVVQYAVKHGVREMFIDFTHRDYYREERYPQFPRCFSQCPSLRKFEIISSHPKYTILPKKMGLTALRSLCLCNILFSKDNFDGSLFSGCPNLQTLHLLDIRCKGLITFDIHAPSLTTLNFGFSGSYLEYLDDCKVMIIAPKLTTFTFYGPRPIACTLDAYSLQDVSIDLSEVAEAVALGEVADDLVLRLIKMVNEFRVAKCMVMTVATIKVLSAIPTLLDGHLSKFENLNHLKIIRMGPYDFVLPPWILKYFLNSTTAMEVCQGRIHGDSRWGIL